MELSKSSARMTPEELEAIPDIDEALIGHIQTSVVAYYGHYDDEQAAAANRAAHPVTEAAPVSAEQIETCNRSGDRRRSAR